MLQRTRQVPAEASSTGPHRSRLWPRLPLLKIPERERTTWQSAWAGQLEAAVSARTRRANQDRIGARSPPPFLEPHPFPQQTTSVALPNSACPHRPLREAGRRRVRARRLETPRGRQSSARGFGEPSAARLLGCVPELEGTCRQGEGWLRSSCAYRREL